MRKTITRAAIAAIAAAAASLYLLAPAATATAATHHGVRYYCIVWNGHRHVTVPCSKFSENPFTGQPPYLMQNVDTLHYAEEEGLGAQYDMGTSKSTGFYRINFKNIGGVGFYEYQDPDGLCMKEDPNIFTVSLSWGASARPGTPRSCGICMRGT